MGRFNGQKSAIARERNAKKLADKVKPGSSLKATQAAMTTICKQCQMAFLGNTGYKAMQQHIDSKHPKNSPADCFPEQVHLWPAPGQ